MERALRQYDAGSNTIIEDSTPESWKLASAAFRIYRKNRIKGFDIAGKMARIFIISMIMNGKANNGNPSHRI